jgi:hypothetical protein
MRSFLGRFAVVSALCIGVAPVGCMAPTDSAEDVEEYDVAAEAKLMASGYVRYGIFDADRVDPDRLLIVADLLDRFADLEENPELELPGVETKGGKGGGKNANGRSGGHGAHNKQNARQLREAAKKARQAGNNAEYKELQKRAKQQVNRAKGTDHPGRKGGGQAGGGGKYRGIAPLFLLPGQKQYLECQADPNACRVQT